MKGLNLLFLMIFLFSLTFATAEQQSLGTYKQNSCVNLIQTCSNCTYVNISSVNYPNGSVILSNVVMAKSGTYYSYNFCNTSFNGVYIVSGHGNPDGQTVVWNYDFVISPNGEEGTVGKAIFYIGLLCVLIFFLAICIYSFVEFDNLGNRVGMFGLGYLLLMAISFIGWNMAKDFITSAPFLIEMLRILFWVLISGAFPLLVGAFAWYLIMLFRIKEIENLMNKGFSEEDAQRRVKRR